MLLERVRRDEHVIEVHEDTVEAAEDVVHEALKRLGRVPQPEGHAHELEESEGSDQGSLGHVLVSHRYLVESLHQIDHRENIFPPEISGEILDVPDWIAIVFRLCI